MKAIEWDYDNCRAVIGSRTEAEAAFQVCNFMNGLFTNIHYSDNKKNFSSGDCMTYDVNIHNLKVTIEDLIKYSATEYSGDVFHLICRMNVLFNEMVMHSIEDDITKIKKAKCHNLWFRILDSLMSEFTLLMLYAKPKSREELSKMFNI